MFDKPFLYFLCKMAAVVASIVINYTDDTDTTVMVISVLSFTCLFLIEILLERVFHKPKFILITVGISMTACFLLGIENLLPVFLILLIHVFDGFINSEMFYYIIVVTMLLSFFIFTPNMITITVSLIILIYLLFCRIILHRLDRSVEINETHKEAISELNRKLIDLKSLTKTLKYTASLEERNRIAARIHDQIGHGISGSIIMLEAALLTMKSNQEKATKSIEKAVTNLREGVDEIRSALREERAGRYQMGMNDVTSLLEEFKVSYSKETILKTTGDLEYITWEMWDCIHDNLKECLTNVLKHSNATEFILNIEVFNKIIKVEYKDNGRSSEDFVKGMGLEAIEERTAKVKGRCFFHKSERGFGVTNIFTY